MRTIVFYTLVDCRTLEFLKEDGYTDEFIFNAIRFDTLQEAQNYSKYEIDDNVQENFFAYKVRLSCYLELMEMEKMQ